MIGLGGLNLGMTVLFVTLVLLALAVLADRRQAKPNPPRRLWTCHRVTHPLQPTRHLWTLGQFRFVLHRFLFGWPVDPAGVDRTGSGN